ncbi:hypothetical protein LWI29_016732 [Acer saccharum]|uniref:Small subunit processome component 20 homolog n=1 Tax=Acer saccharum TaxID=4024 RepID=A0AA39TQ15_ACESA|nr:hypothetical protein LWI29_016732 [Acer saccharum]
MATASHAAAVKSLNKSPGRRRFVFKTLSQRIEDIDINVFRSLDKLKAEPSEGSSFFRDCLIEWRELNTAEDFISFYEEMMPIVQTLPLILLHKELIFSKLISRLQMKARLSLEPILRVTAKLRYYPKEYIQEFMAEATSFLLRNAPIEQVKTGIRKIILEVVKKPSTERKSGVTALLYYVMRGTSSGFHSRAEHVLVLLMSNSIFSIGDKLNQGSETIVEVLISAFQRICDNLGLKELNLMWEHLFQEIIDSVANRSLLHLSRLLSLLIATTQIDNVSQISDYRPLLKLVDLLVHTFMIPSGKEKEIDHLAEVVDKVLQLMLCILDGLYRADDMSTISGFSLQWAAAFELKKSSLLVFIKELLLKDTCLLYTFRVNIISAMNDLIESSQEEVICLLLSFLERLQMNHQCSTFLDGTSKGGVSRIHSFLQEAICSWISVINNIHDNSSSTQIDEAKLVLLWGAIGCYPYFFDVQENSSLLMNLIDALDQLLMNEAEIVAGVCKHTWQSLIGAALASYYKWHLFKNSVLEETSKVLHLAKTYKSSLQVLSAAADCLDYVHGTTLQADTSHKKYHPELEAQKAVDAVLVFADNLCHSDKAIRVPTLRILCHYEPLSCEISTNDQPPQKKMKTETGVSHSSPMDYHGCNVIQLLLSIETTPISISTSRKVILLISRIQMSLTTGRIAEAYIHLVLNGIIGILHNRFSYLWSPASECLAVLISKHAELVWNKFVCYFEHCQSMFQTSHDQLDRKSAKLSNKSGDLVERFDLFVSPASESSPHGTVLSLVLQSLQKAPSVVEPRSRQIVPLFLEFLGYCDNNVVSVGSFNSHICKGKEWKGVLKEWLNLLKLMRNPKSFYRSQFLKDVLQNRLLDENDAEIQIKVLDCLLMWKDDFLLPYDQHLKNLIDSKKMREELTTWSLARESNLIEEGHRVHLVPLVVRLLMPKVRKLKTLASRKHASMNLRKAILGFIAQLDVNELPLFFALLIKPLQIIPKGTDGTVDIFWTIPNCSMDEFQELSFFKYFTIENVAALSWKKIHAFLHVIEDVLGVFDELHVKPFLHLLMGCVARVLFSCTSSLDAVKGDRSFLVENNLSSDLTSNEKDNPVGNHAPASSTKQFKDLRSFCLKIVYIVLDNYEDHDFGAEFWDLFFKSVKSLIDAFKYEGSSSEKPSSLFSCFLAMSRSHKLVSLLYRENSLVPDIFSILTVTTASQAIVFSVLKFVQNLLAHEYVDVKRLLLPNLEALICSLHCCFQSATKRKLVKSSGEAEIKIFEVLSKYIKDPLQAKTFVEILLPFLEKGVKDSVLRDIIPVAGTESTKKILSVVSPLLVSVELDMRLCICDLLEALAEADSSVQFPAKLVRELNATSASEMGSLDYDTIINAYKKIGVDLFYTREEDHTLLILSHCVHDMSSEELILRQSAYRSLLSFVEFSSRILDGEKIYDHEVQIINESCWTRTSIQQVINKFLLKHVGEAMRRGSKVKKEWIDLLREMILKLPQLSNLNSFKDLCSGDSEVDFFKNIIHLQKHRRARALFRFRKVIGTSNMSEGFINKVFVPLFFNMLFDAQEENIKKAFIDALASISAHVEWKSYYSLLTRCFQDQEMDKNPQKQKTLLRLFCSILDQFHFSQICSNQEPKDSMDSILRANTDNATSVAFHGYHSSDLVGEIKTCLLETVLPRVQKVLHSASGEVNVDINRAALKLLKLLPGDIMDSQLPSIIQRISNFLKSRSDGIRNGARLALADCLKELGLEYLHFIVKSLGAVLKRGFELHVLGYTLNFILSKNLSIPVSGKLDYCLDALLLVVEKDILGDVSEQKEVEKIASKMIETRKQKSFETLELIARNITFKTHALKLLSFVTIHLQKHLTPKVKSKFESMLDHIAAGIECNPSVDQTDLFVFIYGLIEDRIKEENGKHEILSNTEAKKHKNDVKGKTIRSGRVIVAKSAGSHLITVFALRLLHKRLKNAKSNQYDEEQLSMLDSFVTLLGNCLSSKYEDVLSESLRCLTPLVSLPLPSLESQAEKIKATLLDIAHNSVNSSSPLVQSCLSLLTKLLRSTKITLSSDQLHLLIRFPLFVDLERNPSDVALLLLKAIVNRKLVVPEIYDVIVQVAKLMVTSQAESIRKKCSQILLQFLLDYHLSEKRLLQHFRILRKSLRYEHSSGREAVLEMLHTIIKKFPQTEVDKQSLSLFFHLVARLVNDHDNKVRSMAGVAIKLLIGRVSPHLLDSIMNKCQIWYLGESQQLWGVGAQVLGLSVEVMKKDFQKHLNNILPKTKSILQSAVSVVADGELDLPDEATIPFWKEAYYSLVLLEKILCQFPDIILERDLENIWEATCELLLHPHTWLRNRSNHLIAMYITVVTDATREHHDKQLGTLFLMKPSRLFMISASLCCQLEAQLSFHDAVSSRITQNLVFAICNMHSLKERREYVDPHSYWSTLGESERSLFLKAFQLLDSGKEKGLFLSLISGACDQNDQDDSKDLGFLLVSSLLKKMGKIALLKEDIQMGIVFNSFRLISSEISPEYCRRYASQMLTSLYKVSEGFAGKVISDDMKQLAQEVCDSIKNKLGNQEFIAVYNEMRKSLKVKREKRKREEKVMAVVNPERHAKRKLRISAKHTAHKKRKMMSMKLGRCPHLLRSGPRKGLGLQFLALHYINHCLIDFCSMGISSDNVHGLVLALSSSIFIGSSFIIKKKGLKNAAATGASAGSGGHAYLYEPWWWIGMITMIIGEIANFAAYAFAPAILVTPLGALSIIFCAVLAHFILLEKLHIFGVLGCILCVVGSTSIVLHAPQERNIESVEEVWRLATAPGFLIYGCIVLIVVATLIFKYVPTHGHTHLIVYVGICSLMGSLTVMSVKALGIALKLTFSGSNQFKYYETWVFTIIVIFCCLLQINYLNKALDTFNTAVISPTYYVLFTSFTILASIIMFKDWDTQNASQIATELCGFVTILSGTFLLHKTKDMGNSPSLNSSSYVNQNSNLNSNSGYRNENVG